MREQGKGKRKATAYLVCFFKELAAQYVKHSVAKNAAELSYYLLFSFFPMLIFINITLSFIEIRPDIVLSRVEGYLPPDIVEIINNYLLHIPTIQSARLLLFGIVFTFWSVYRALSSLIDDVSVAYGADKRRGVVMDLLFKGILTVMLMVSISVSLITAVLGTDTVDMFSKFGYIPDMFVNIWGFIRFPIMAAPVLVTLSVIYRAAQDREDRKKYRGARMYKYILPGAFAAILIFGASSLGFSFYVENMAEYSVLYGSLGAVIVLMMWLYFCSLSLILGAEFNHALFYADSKFAKTPTPSEET